MYFLKLSPQNYTLLYKYFKNTVKLESMGMQKISDKMYVDTIANRQKKYSGRSLSVADKRLPHIQHVMNILL